VDDQARLAGDKAPLGRPKVHANPRPKNPNTIPRSRTSAPRPSGPLSRPGRRARASGVVSYFEDRLSGGSKVEDRPAMLEAFGALRAAGAGLLVAAKRDRIARDVVVRRKAESHRPTRCTGLS